MSHSLPERILLHHVEGPRRGDVDAFAKPSIVVGRAPDCDLVFTDERSTSSHHAVIRQSEGRIEVVDTHSTNGTFVNDVRVDRCELNDGDTLRFGALGPLVKVAVPGRRETKTVRDLPAMPASPDSAAVTPPASTERAALITPALRQMRHWRFARNAMVIYVGTAIALTQGADVIVDRYGLPREAFTSFLLLLAAGFFTTLIAAGYRGAPGEQSTQRLEIFLHSVVGLVVVVALVGIWL